MGHTSSETLPSIFSRKLCHNISRGGCLLGGWIMNLSLSFLAFDSNHAIVRIVTSYCYELRHWWNVVGRSNCYVGPIRATTSFPRMITNRAITHA
jgi:hypothetical protein